MSLNTLITLAVAALVLALASSYLLWFGPAARKPFLHKARELLKFDPEDNDEEKGLIDPHEHLSITNDDAPLENSLSKENKDRPESRKREKDAEKNAKNKTVKSDDELIT